MRHTWMDALRGIAMALVVLLHAGLALEYYATAYPEPIRIFNDIFEPYRMPTLMFLSGMLLSKSLSKPALRYFDGKVRKVVWPYLVWSVIALALQGDLSLYAMGRAVYNPLETHLWYLWFLIIFYAVAWLIRRVPPVIPALLALGLSVFAPSDFRLDRMTFLFAFFMLGHAFSLHATRLQKITQKPYVIAISAALAISASALNVADITVLYEPVFAVAVLGAIILAMWLVPMIPTGWVLTALTYIGERSVILYIVHLLAIKVAGTVLQRLGLENPWLLFPILVAVGIGSGLFLMILTDRIRAANILFEWPVFRTRVRAASQALPPEKRDRQ